MTGADKSRRADTDGGTSEPASGAVTFDPRQRTAAILFLRQAAAISLPAQTRPTKHAQIQKQKEKPPAGRGDPCTHQIFGAPGGGIAP